MGTFITNDAGEIISRFERPQPALGTIAIDDTDPRAIAFLGGATPAQLVAYANDKQWILATGGYTATINGQALIFPTDQASQALLTGKAVRLGQANPPTTVDWQFASGFVTIAAADFLVAAVAIADFVQATFETLKAVLAAITAGTVKVPADIDAWAWPANHA